MRIALGPQPVAVFQPQEPEEPLAEKQGPQAVMSEVFE